MHVRFKHLVEDNDRRGNRRIYVRVPGRPKVRMTTEFGTPEFIAEYTKALYQPTPTQEITMPIHNRLQVEDVPSEAMADLDAIVVKNGFTDAKGFAVYKGEWTDKTIAAKLNEKWEGFMGLCTDGTAKKFTASHVKDARIRLLGRLRTPTDKAAERAFAAAAAPAPTPVLKVPRDMTALEYMSRRMDDFARDLAEIKTILKGTLAVDAPRVEQKVDALNKQVALANDVADYLTRTTDYQRPEFGPAATLMLPAE